MDESPAQVEDATPGHDPAPPIGAGAPATPGDSDMREGGASGGGGGDAGEEESMEASSEEDEEEDGLMFGPQVRVDYGVGWSWFGRVLLVGERASVAAAAAGAARGKTAAFNQGPAHTVAQPVFAVAVVEPCPH